MHMAALAETEDLLPTRHSLLLRMQDMSDERSWRDFFEGYWKLIYQTAVRAGLTGPEAEDVVQETVIAVCRNIGGFDYQPERGRFKSWLLQLTRWRIQDRLRLRRIRSRREIPLPMAQALQEEEVTDADLVDAISEAQAPELEMIWDEEWDRNLLEAAARMAKQRVTERQYQLFDLYVLKQWPMSLITSAFNVGPTAVYMAKHRVGRIVKQEIRKLQGHTP
jgi:RNA polymerase sigma-70 factor (ECF subfamily)